ncbi:DUF4013 domain-containing protein [Methanoregula sp.]|uniref:DUF4013 domain-containing protein n=1 Tax=Methanoregula sp. TaxID=2052170 RepID=UPI003C768370
MDYGALIGESIDYSREALTGRWTTWLVFIICGIPMALIRFLFDPTKIVDNASKTIHWELIPWPQLIALIIAGFLLSFIISGYCVRVYRGTTPPPVFDNWISLYLDGIKLVVVDILWAVPAMLVLIISFAILIVGAVTVKGPMPLILIPVILLLLLAAVVLAVIAILYSILGSVRFSRTGSIREGVRFSAISGTIERIGWGTYIIALVVLLMTWFIFIIIIGILALIPFVGWAFNLAITPFFTVFNARYISRVYDHDIPQAPATVPETAL